jgi:hypothetical protein
MHVCLRRSLVCAAAAALTAAMPLAAVADMNDVLSQSIVQSANNALKDALRARDTTAQARPIGEQERPLASPGLPTGLTYGVDWSMAKSEGNTGARTNALPGGMDGLLAYGFSPHLRIQAAYYDFQEYPLAFDTGTVPTYLQGISPPIGATNLATNPIDATTKNNIVVLQAQNLFVIGHKLPIIITPTYLSRTGTVGGQSDLIQIENNGFPVTVHFRTVQYYLVALTIPVLSTSKFFGTLTIAPQWNVNLSGIQTTNHAQLFELAYFEYRPTTNVTVFFQPSRLVNNLPSDATPQYIPTFIEGASYKFTKYTYVQVVASTGTPSNRSQLGITALTLTQVPTMNPPPASQVAPTIAGLKATQIQVMFGIGSPSVIPL